jgi:hypothetical protein
MSSPVNGMEVNGFNLEAIHRFLLQYTYNVTRSCLYIEI